MKPICLKYVLKVTYKHEQPIIIMYNYINLGFSDLVCTHYAM